MSPSKVVESHCFIVFPYVFILLSPMMGFFWTSAAREPKPHQVRWRKSWGWKRMPFQWVCLELEFPWTIIMFLHIYLNWNQIKNPQTSLNRCFRIFWCIKTQLRHPVHLGPLAAMNHYPPYLKKAHAKELTYATWRKRKIIDSKNYLP